MYLARLQARFLFALIIGQAVTTPFAVAETDFFPTCAEMYDALALDPSVPESKFFTSAQLLKTNWDSQKEKFQERLFAAFEPYFIRKSVPEIRKKNLTEMLTLVQQTLREGKKQIPPAVKRKISALKEDIQEAQLAYHESFLEEAAKYFRAAGVKFKLIHFQDGSHTRNVIQFEGGMGKFHPELRSRDRLVKEGLLTNTLDPYANLRKQSLGFAGHAQSTYGVEAMLSLLRGNPRTIAHENIHNLHALRSFKEINPHVIAFNDPAGQVAPNSGYARRMQADERITHAADGARVLKIVLDHLLRKSKLSEAEKDLVPLMGEAQKKLERAKQYNSVTKDWTSRALDEKWEMDSSPTSWGFLTRDTPEEGMNTYRVGGRNHPKYDKDMIKFRKDPGDDSSPFLTVPVSRSLGIPADELGAHVSKALEYLQESATTHLAIADKNIRIFNGIEQLLVQLKNLETNRPQELAELMKKLKAMPAGQRAAFLKGLEGCQTGCNSEKIQSLIDETALPPRK